MAEPKLSKYGRRIIRSITFHEMQARKIDDLLWKYQMEQKAEHHRDEAAIWRELLAVTDPGAEVPTTLPPESRK